MKEIKEGYKATITDKDGVVMDVIQLGGYNLEKPMARAALIDNIQNALPSEAFDPPEGDMSLTTEEIDHIATRSADEIVKRLNQGSNPSARGIDINKLPGYAYFWGSNKPFTIVWEKHKDGTVSFTSLRLIANDLADFIKE